VKSQLFNVWICLFLMSIVSPTSPLLFSRYARRINRGRKRPLCAANDAVARVFRNETVIVQDDAHNWNVDARENVRWSANDRQKAQDQHQYGCVRDWKRLFPYSDEEKGQIQQERPEGFLRWLLLAVARSFSSLLNPV